MILVLVMLPYSSSLFLLDSTNQTKVEGFKNCSVRDIKLRSPANGLFFNMPKITNLDHGQPY